MQAALAGIGETMGFRIWLPNGERQRVLELWHPADRDVLLTHLPRVSYAPIQDIYNGKSVHLDAAVPKGRICMYDQEQAVAIYEYSHGDVYRCVRGIW